MLGCGFIKEYREAGPTIDIRVVGMGAEQNWKCTVCPGYSTAMSEVREAQLNHRWALAGQPIKDRYQGEELTPECIMAADILISANNVVSNYEANERLKKMQNNR